MSDQPITPTPSHPDSKNATEATNHTQPVRGNWGEQRTKLKEQFPTLTDADFRYEKGKKEEMLKSVQVKLGKTKEEFDTIISEL